MTYEPQYLYICVVTIVFVCQSVVSIAKFEDYTNGDHSEELDTLYDRKNHFLPTFLPTPSNITYNRGEEAVLQCAIENRGTRTIVWRRASDPNPLTIGMDTYIGDSRFKVIHKKHSLEWNLHISDVTPEDSGVYECQVSAKRRHIRQNVMLTVQEAPEKSTSKPEISIHGTLFVERGDTLRLTCNATGSEYPPDAIDWFKDGDKIKNNDRVTLSSDVSLSDRTISSTLSIKRGNMTDAGTYICRTPGNLVTSAKVNILNTGTNNEKRVPFIPESVDMTAGPSRSGNSCLRGSEPSRRLLLAMILLTIVCFRGKNFISKHSS
ncbi:myosin light chain kinase, smooth muscle-like isoform X3 [Biomphalaria glabrata]|uniref:Myosin light chain kinase, smooth muscle-like isoform X3 n=1 Tax=Biomphalaria glabrata TaxID=6526 RepID=A0A9W3AYS8_BIOGL|nr:myosin light chain kinase, smooth muscle-like isoform X3 [Biomphalaria glabrata]